VRDTPIQLQSARRRGSPGKGKTMTVASISAAMTSLQRSAWIGGHYGEAGTLARSRPREKRCRERKGGDGGVWALLKPTRRREQGGPAPTYGRHPDR
jgi:hypothetical protein